MKTLYFLGALCLVSNVMIAQELSTHIDLGLSSTLGETSKIAIDNDGNIVHIGFVTDYADADPGIGVTMINPESEFGVTISKFNSANEFLWAHFFPVEDYPFFSIACDAENNVILAIDKAGATDFDPGVGEAIIGTNNVHLVVKYSPTGDFLWASAAVSSANCMNYDVAVLSDGAIMTSGNFNGTIDFDPGAGEHIVDTPGISHGTFLWKLDSNGDFEWVASYFSIAGIQGRTIEIDHLDNIILRGLFHEPTDMDPGPDEYIIEPQINTHTQFIAKYSSSGSLVWAFPLDLYMEVGSGSLIDSDADGNIIVAGNFSNDAADFDPGPEVVSSELNLFTANTFIAKYSPEGNFIWLRTTHSFLFRALHIDSENNIYLTGECFLNADADPGFGISLLNESGNESIFCAKYNSLGQLYWAFDLYTTDMGDGTPNSNCIDMRNDEIVISGAYEGIIDLNPGSEETILDEYADSYAFIATYVEGPCANSVLTISSGENINCIEQTGMATVEFLNGMEPYEYEWNTGETTTTIYPTTTGIYTVNGIEAGGCSDSLSLLINGPITLNGFDLNPLVIASGFSSGFSTYIQLDAFNEGCELVDGTLVLTLDPILLVGNVYPAPDNVNGNELTWNFTSLSYESEHLIPAVEVVTPATTEIGANVEITIAMNPSFGDYNPTNNVKNYTYVVTSSFDPNAKKVYPQGTGPEGYIGNNQTMTYTVQFQNTGTAPAVNVYILDPIESNLDISTVQVIASSHSMYTEVLDNNVLKFVFNNIMLPDSTSNEPESHGYVVFTIEQQSNLPAYTEIENTAGIYFDFNEPIITNTVLNTIASGVGTEQISHQHFTTYPNPALDRLFMTLSPTSLYSYEVFSSEGKLVSQGMNLSPSLGIDISKLKPALYQLKLSGTEGSYISRFVKQ